MRDGAQIRAGAEMTFSFIELMNVCWLMVSIHTIHFVVGYETVIEACFVITTEFVYKIFFLHVKWK